MPISDSVLMNHAALRLNSPSASARVRRLFLASTSVPEIALPDTIELMPIQGLNEAARKASVVIARGMPLSTSSRRRGVSKALSRPWVLMKPSPCKAILVSRAMPPPSALTLAILAGLMVSACSRLQRRPSSGVFWLSFSSASRKGVMFSS